MRAYRIYWENGTDSIVFAKSKKEAIEISDELDDECAIEKIEKLDTDKLNGIIIDTRWSVNTEDITEYDNLDIAVYNLFDTVFEYKSKKIQQEGE